MVTSYFTKLRQLAFQPRSTSVTMKRSVPGYLRYYDIFVWNSAIDCIQVDVYVFKKSIKVCILEWIYYIFYDKHFYHSIHLWHYLKGNKCVLKVKLSKRTWHLEIQILKNRIVLFYKLTIFHAFPPTPTVNCSMCL